MDFVDELFKAGCGSLGWPPDVVLSTPIPQVMLALEGKFDFAAKTNPFGGKAAKPRKPDDPAVVREKQATLDAIKAKAKAVREKKCQKQQKDS